MGSNASAAEAAARAHHGGATAAGPAPNRSTFGGRRVSEAAAGARGPSVGDRRQRSTDARPGGTHPNSHSRRVSILSSVYARLRLTARSGSHGSAGRPPSGATPVAGFPESLDERLEGAERAPRPRTTDRPWFSGARNEELRTANTRLRELLERPDIPADIKHELSALGRCVSSVEQDIAQADTLLKRSRREVLTAAEWSELSELIASVPRNLWVFQDAWESRLGRLWASGALSPPDMDLVGTLRQRHEDAYAYFYSNDLPWEDSVRRVVTMLPAGPRQPVVVESRVLPGAAFGAHFVDDSLVRDNTAPNVSDQYRHVPDLEQTVLTDAGGRTLFSALRHSSIQVEGLSGPFLATAGGDALKALLRDLYMPSFATPCAVGRLPFQQARERQIDDACRLIRSDLQAADQYASFMRAAARASMFRELAAAALASDPRNLLRALDKKIVNLKLFAIVLDPPPEPQSLESSTWMFHNWNGRLHVRGRDGQPRLVQVVVNVRRFDVSPGDRQLEPMSDDAGELRFLLGPLDSGALGGDAKRTADDMKDRCSRLRPVLARLALQYSRIAAVRGADDGDVRRKRRELSELGNEMDRLRRDVDTLTEAVRQLKILWMAGDRWPSGVEGQRKAAARLALVAHLMGEIPLLSCPSGTAGTRELDPEIKFLATVAANRNGTLPPLDLDPEVWGRARDDFRPQ